MQIVIDIPEEMHKALEQGSFGAKYNMYDLIGCAMNGILLPKGHGRLIDADEIQFDNQQFDTYRDYSMAFDAIDYAPIVIGSDRRQDGMNA